MSEATREAWLLTLAGKMAPVLEERAGVTLPAFRVTCGFPSKGGTIGRKSRVRGQSWSAAESEDGHAEIFISPVEDETETIAAILAHEMLHAALPQAGHRRPFQLAARAIGHEVPFTTASPTAVFWQWAKPLVDELGAYPHRRLNAASPVAARKPQKNRQIKCACRTCGYIARAARRWIESVGPPHCPKHGAMEVE